MIEKILFPVDFSPSCVAMAPFVKKGAAMFSAKVTLLHVLEPPSSGFELYVRPLREVEEDREQVARAKLDSFLVSEFLPPASSRVLRMGDAATRIVETARAGGFDLIITPTHAGVFRRMLLGSTTAKVLNDAECPITQKRSCPCHSSIVSGFAPSGCRRIPKEYFGMPAS